MDATLVLVATAGLVVAVDASTKAAACRLPAIGVGHRSFGLRLVLNRRAGFGGATPPAAAAILGLLAVAAAGLAAATELPASTAASLGLALGGAVGNVVDRLLRGAVVDFVVVGRWPAFNVADVALVGGAVAAIVSAVA